MLWFLVPWIGFTFYSGEISNYYFVMSLPVIIYILAYLTEWVYSRKYLPIKILIVLFWIYFFVINMNLFSKNPLPYEFSLQYYKEVVRKSIREDKKIEFQEGVPQAYLYYIYTKK